MQHGKDTSQYLASSRTFQNFLFSIAVFFYYPESISPGVQKGWRTASHKNALADGRRVHRHAVEVSLIQTFAPRRLQPPSNFCIVSNWNWKDPRSRNLCPSTRRRDCRRTDLPRLFFRNLTSFLYNLIKSTFANQLNIFLKITKFLFNSKFNFSESEMCKVNDIHFVFPEIRS